MEASPGVLHHHLDAIDFNEGGGLLLAASSLTHRYWVGALFYFQEAEFAPDVNACSAMIQLDTGLADLKTVKSSNKFVCGADTGSVQLWETKEDPESKQITMSCLAEPVEHDNFVTSLSINADATKVVSSSQDCRLKVWDMEEFVSVNTFKAHSDAVNMAACHPKECSVFISCSQDGKLLLWDTRKAKPASFIDNQYLPAAPTCVAWQPGNDHSIAIGTESGHMLLQDTRKGVSVPVVSKPHERPVHKMAFAPHRSDWLATASNDSTAAVLQFDEDTTASLIEHIQTHSDFVQDVAWHPFTHSLFSCGWDTRIKITSILSDFSKPQTEIEVSGDHMSDHVTGAVEDIKQNKLEQMEVVDGATVET